MPATPQSPSCCGNQLYSTLRQNTVESAQRSRAGAAALSSFTGRADRWPTAAASMRGTLAALGGGGTPAAGALGPSQSHPLPASRYCVGKALRVLSSCYKGGRGPEIGSEQLWSGYGEEMNRGEPLPTCSVYARCRPCPAKPEDIMYTLRSAAPPHNAAAWSST